jgi:hypothetical protein
VEDIGVVAAHVFDEKDKLWVLCFAQVSPSWDHLKFYGHGEQSFELIIRHFAYLLLTALWRASRRKIFHRG